MPRSSAPLPAAGVALPVPAPRAARGVVVTAAGPGMRAVLHDLALPSFERWARRWGWAVGATDLPMDGVATDEAAQRAKWTKVALLRSALQRHPLALWLDADVLLLRDDEDVSEHLIPGTFQALALEQVPQERRVNPNTGVWLLRSCPAAFAFLDQVESHGTQPGPWADQGAVLAALGWHRGDERYRGARPGPGNAALTATSWLPTGWNQPYQGDRDEHEAFGSGAGTYDDRPAVPAPHALHFMGMTPAARYRAMAAAVREPVVARIGWASTPPTILAVCGVGE